MIKWVGVIKDISEYQKGELLQDARKLDTPKTMDEVMKKALPFVIFPTLVIFLSIFLKTYMSDERIISFPYFMVGFLLGFPMLLLHEYLHGIAFPRDAVVYIGVFPKSFAAVALTSYPISRNRFIFMSLLPTILGIIPLLLFWIIPSEYEESISLLIGLSVLGLGSPYPDYYNVFQVLRQTPAGCKIQSVEDDTYYI